MCARWTARGSPRWRTSGAPTGAYQVAATLRDPAGKIVTTLRGTTQLDGSAADLKLSGLVRNPATWSDETPTLYSLVVSLTDPTGRVVHRTSQRVGFREVEVKDKQVSNRLSEAARLGQAGRAADRAGHRDRRVRAAGAWNCGHVVGADRLDGPAVLLSLGDIAGGQTKSATFTVTPAGTDG
jgi:hypothetical protein